MTARAPIPAPGGSPARVPTAALLPNVVAEARLVFRTARLARALAWWTGAQWVLSFGVLGILALLRASHWRLGPIAYDVSLLSTASGALLIAPGLEPRLDRGTALRPPRPVGRARAGGARPTRTPRAPGGRHVPPGAVARPTRTPRAPGTVPVLARLLVVLPFAAAQVVPLTVIGLGLQGASPWAVPVHLLLLVLIGWVACAMSWAAQARTPQLTAGIVYALTTAAVLGPPAAVLGLGTVLTVEQEQTIHSINGDTSATACLSEETRTATVSRSELYWWLLVADPFAALADGSARGPALDGSGDEPAWLVGSLNTLLGLNMDDLRDAHPSRVEIHRCGDDVAWDHTRTTILVQPEHAPFWPASALLMAVVAVIAGAVGSRAPATPRPGAGPRRRGRE